jgi:hypothetical protein
MSLSVLRTIVMVAAILGVALLTGCSDDEDQGYGKQPVLVRVTDEVDGSSVAGVKVIVMDPVANIPLSGPVVSGTDGFCQFGPATRDELRFLVFGGVDYRVYSLPNGWLTKRDAEDRTLLAPDGKSDPVRFTEVQVRKVAPDSLPRIAGTVVDGGTGAPLNRVFVSLSPYMSGYQGATSASDDVTGSFGKFSVSQVPFLVDSQTGNLFQVEPLRFTRQGYRPLVWKFDPPNGSENVDISGVTISMEPVSAEDTGSLSGMILLDGLPATGIVVGLGVVAMPGKDKAGPAMTGWTAVTDTEGNYTISGLPAGVYLLRPGYLLNDGAFFPSQAGNIPRQVNQGEDILADDLVVLHEITAVYPPHGFRTSARPDSLFWTSVFGATNYEVSIDGTTLPWATTNALEIPESVLINPGLHFWTVLAIKDQSEIVGATQLQPLFRYAPP